MAQGAWVRTPPTTVPGHDIIGDVKCSEFVSVGDTSPREINSQDLTKPFLSMMRVTVVTVSVNSAVEVCHVR